jgi:predicted NACHT family NTPase
LDGLDEIFDRKEREQVISDICRFSNQYKKVRIIITSRMVGYEAHRLRDAEFRDFMLQDFSPEQIEQFLGRWHEVIFADNQTEGRRKQERLAKAIKESKPIALLAATPSCSL